MKAVVLLSGGLDSILATRLVLEQGIEVEAINFLTVFCTCTSKSRSCLASKSAAGQLGIKLKVMEVSQEYFEIVKKPRYGYGSNMNPCLDCRIFMFKKAKDYMYKTGASFLITGEVLDERPMSQRKQAMQIIERDSGLDGLIVRPLSARLLKPTIPEQKGWVDRDRFLAIKGRSRKAQIYLAKDLGITDYPCPAGGCLLTDAGFSRRIRDLMQHKKDFTINDVQMLKLGRHFRFNPSAKLIVGRNQDENKKLIDFTKTDDLCFYPVKTKGPVGIGRGLFDKDSLLLATSIIAKYSDRYSDTEKIQIACSRALSNTVDFILSVPIDDDRLNLLRI